MKKIFLSFLLLFLATGCLKPQSSTAVFSDVWYSGYEGYFTNVSYTLDYDSEKVTISKVKENNLKLVDLDTGKESEVLFFNNDGAGFSSSKDLWENYYKEFSKCSDCVVRSNILSFNASNFQDAPTDMLTFENASEYWVITKVYPGFIIIKLAKTSENTRKVLETLTWHYTQIVPS